MGFVLDRKLAALLRSAPYVYDSEGRLVPDASKTCRGVPERRTLAQDPLTASLCLGKDFTPKPAP